MKCGAGLRQAAEKRRRAAEKQQLFPGVLKRLEGETLVNQVVDVQIEEDSLIISIFQFP